MWKPLFLYYFLLIATMTKTMFVNSQKLLFIILFLCELITLHKIHMISLFLFYFFLFSFIHLGSWQDSKALDSTLIFIIDNSRTRLHRWIAKKTRNYFKPRLYFTRSRYYQRIELRKTVKIKVMVIRYRGTPPSLAVAKGSAHTWYSIRLWW